MNTTTASKTTAVRSVLLGLTDAGIAATFGNTGGGCHAVEVFHNGRDYADGYLLITDTEGPYTDGDLDSDEDVSGYFVDAYDGEGDSTTDGEGLYLTPAGTRLGADSTAVVRVVRKFLA